MQQNGYRKLIVWQKAMDMVVLTYEFVKTFPKEEVFGLTSQIKRAAVSIPSNIAEGNRRASDKDRRHFLVMAFGSVAELETQLEIANRLGFGKQEKYDMIAPLLDEVARMLNKMTSN